MTLFLFVIGLALTIIGAEALVNGASRLAAALGIPPLIVGLTIVAFGTSAPELVVSISSAWQGKSDIAVSNVVGSNIFNVLFILGIAAIITPLRVDRSIVRRDLPLVILLSALAFLLALDHAFGRLDGLLLASGLVAYTVFAIRSGRREASAQAVEKPEESTARTSVPLRDGGLVVFGLAALVVGSSWLIDGSIAFASWLGVGEVVIGLTIVSAGTSLPEVATSIMAALRGERDIAVGNVVGSNIFNLLGVLGISALSSPEPLIVAGSVLALDLPVMVATAVACLPLLATGHLIARWEAALFLAYYIAYATFLILRATEHAALAGFTSAMLFFVIPLTALTIFVTTWRSWTASRKMTT